jgi:hypothetical protein
MEAEVVSETSDFCSELTRLIARKNIGLIIILFVYSSSKSKMIHIGIIFTEREYFGVLLAITSCSVVAEFDSYTYA